MRKQRSDPELFEASKHVGYEVDQVNDSIMRLATFGLQHNDQMLYNAVLTAFTVHARNLYLFLYGHSPRRNDIVADDYFDDAQTWTFARPAETGLLTETSDRVNKLSAHLTYERTEPPHYWMWMDIHRDLQTALRQFVQLAPAPRIHPALRNFEQKWAWADKLRQPQ